MLAWLVPVATNTTKAHHGFGWVSEWAKTGPSLDVGMSTQTNPLLIQTLHQADRKKTESVILKMLILLHDLVSLARANILEFRSVSSRRVSDYDLELYETKELTDLDATAEKKISEDLEQQNHDVDDREFKPELRLSQDLERVSSNGDSSRNLKKSSSHSSSKSVEELLSPSAINHVHFVTVIDFGIDPVKSLDVIDRVDHIY